ncbi:MAG: hypothetical protein H3C43_08960 [Leptonema sp. (in: Bacteria)]|nr:hypothetical protein [Leptonema sp. (in: bacteria)]
MNKTAILVQARSRSTRLPQKCFLPLPKLSNQTIIDWVHYRLSLTEIDVWFLVPSTDTPIQTYLEKAGIPYLIGSEDDVRERYRIAAQKLDLDFIVRATADNPFVEWQHVIMSIKQIQELQCDLFSFTGLPLGLGVEIFRRDSLCADIEPIQPIHREHVSLHIKHYPEKFKVVHQLSPIIRTWQKETNISLDTIRLTIDEDADYNTALKIADHLSIDFKLHQLLQLIESKPELFTGNQDIEQRRFYRS